VGLEWLGAEKARVSTNGGKRWHDAISVVGSLEPRTAERRRSVAGATTRARLDDAERRPRADLVEVVGPVRTIASFGQSAPYKGGFDVEIVPSQGGTSARSGACRTSGCDLLSAQTRIDVMWSDSTDGAGWSAPSLVQGSVHADQAINESPTAVWLDGGTDRGLHGPQRRLDQLRDVPSRRLVTHEEGAEN
jgi:hypothetical protein